MPGVDSMIRAIAGSAVRSPTSSSHCAPGGIANDALGSDTVTVSPTQSPAAHSVTRPCVVHDDVERQLAAGNERTV